MAVEDYGKNLKKAAIGLCIGIAVAMLAFAVIQLRSEEAAEFVVREEICASACADRGSEPHSVYRQQLGFGAREWRCGCMDGHVQVIP